MINSASIMVVCVLSVNIVNVCVYIMCVCVCVYHGCVSSVVISTSGSVHSTSSGLGNTPTSLSQPSSSQATAFVQPTQQQASNQEVASSMDQERPSTSSPVIGGGNT